MIFAIFVCHVCLMMLGGGSDPRQASAVTAGREVAALVTVLSGAHPSINRARPS